MSPDFPTWVAFKSGLHELGYVEGENLNFEGRFAGGDLDRLPELARELAATNPDAILVFGPTPMRSALAATKRLFDVKEDDIEAYTQPIEALAQAQEAREAQRRLESQSSSAPSKRQRPPKEGR
jgi:hypothetical protein